VEIKRTTPEGTTSSSRVLSAFRASLPAAAATNTRLIASEGHRSELKVLSQRVRVQWLTSGLPSEVRERITTHKTRPDVVVARFLSPGAKAALSELRIGWIDETGAAEIVLGTIVVSRSGRAQPHGSRRTERWTPAVLGIAEALLCGVRPTVEAANMATGISGGACGNALRFLTQAGILVAGAARGPASGRRIVDRRAFLATYASEASARLPTPQLILGVTWRDPIRGLTELGERWTAQGITWAATGSVAAAVMAPLLTNVGSATAYVEATSMASLEALAEKSGLRPIEGGRLTIAPFPTASTRLLAQTFENMRVAPWPRVYADLRVTGVRGEEAADHLVEVMNERGT
jgi:hypothetical protein